MKNLYNRIDDLRVHDRLGAYKIADIILKEFPEETVEETRPSLISKISRYLKRKGWETLKKTPINITINAVQNNITTSNIDTSTTNNTLNATQINTSYAPTESDTTTAEEIVDNNVLEKSKKSVEYKADGSCVYESIIALFENEEITPERIMQAHHLDPTKWIVCSYKNNYWSQQCKEGKKVILYQSKLVVKPKPEDEVTVEELLTYFSNNMPTVEDIPDIHNILPAIISPDTLPDTSSNNIETSNNLMMEINICDLHLGKLATSDTSNDIYDCGIAYNNFFNVINKQCIIAKQNKVEKILFVWSNDFFNSDGISNTTTAGTPQTNCMNWQQLFLQGVKMLIEAITLLSAIAPVKTFYIASNHSRQADWYALCYISAWFRNSDNITIDISQKTRYYEKYGVNLIGFSHSYYEKESSLYHLMSTECPQEWSECTYKEFHLAHYHSEKVKEVGGVIYRWLPSTCGTDNWHYEKGFIGAVKRSYSFIYDKYKGLNQINCIVI